MIAFLDSFEYGVFAMNAVQPAAVLDSAPA